LWRVEPGAVWDFRTAVVVNGPRWLKRNAEWKTKDVYGAKMAIRVLATS
jgi:hypothetical protein